MALQWKALLIGAAIASAALPIGCGSSSGGDDATADEGGSDATADEGGNDALDAGDGTEGGADVTDANGDSEGGEEDDTYVSPECAIPEGKPCNALCHTGCGEGQACLFLGASWECVTAGTKGPGEVCSSPQDCTAGVCAATDEEADATCLAPCLADDDCEEQGLEGALCNANVGGALPFKFCGAPPEPCDLFGDMPCEGETEACYLSGDTTVCAEAGDGVVGDKCSQSSQCSPSHTCISVAGVSGCVRVCAMAGGGEKGCGTVCGGGDFDSLSAGVGYCTDDIDLPFCTPLDPVECKPGQGCYDTADGWICLGAGIKEEKEGCTGSAQCQPGLVCYANKCRMLCNPAVSPSNPKCNSPAISCVGIPGSASPAGYCDQ